MPIFQLADDLIFPPVDGAEDGIVAVGGDLLPERLLLAYASGIFPWYNEGDPIIWWSPDPRFVLFPDRLHVSRSLQRMLKKGTFKVTFNQEFDKVMHQCRHMDRKGQSGTWINDEMEIAYNRLHDLGHAHSVEVWKNNELVGGMYGVMTRNVFSGESMFSTVSNASKIGLVTFIRWFQEQGGTLFDCQVHSDHMVSMGAEEISRTAFLEFLIKS